MPTQRFLVAALGAVLLSGGLAHAAELEGRGHTWNFEVNAGGAFLDGGFGPSVLGYTVPSSLIGKVPNTRPDNLDSTIVTLGFRAGYNFTRFFGVEMSAASGSTSVGDKSVFTLEPALQFPVATRTRILQEQAAVIPVINDRLTSIDYDYLGGTVTAVFSFNNRPTSRWTLYFELGGGVYSLDTDTEAFNECATGATATVFTDPSARIFNGDPNAQSSPDRTPDNPQQISGFDLGCGRSFPIASRTTVNPLTFTFGQPTFREAEAVLEDPGLPDDSPFLTEEGGTCLDLLICDGTPIYTVAPGQVVDNGQRQINPIRSLTNSQYTAGIGLRYWLKPRQSVRVDFRRNFDEQINKNINEFVLGYSFTVGKGKDIRSQTLTPPPPAPDEGDTDDAGDLPPPATDEGDGIPPPSDDDPPGRS
ncbi:MAG: hypothetical protein ACE5IK_01505 [Acidobacteriota bacterium]